MRGLFDAYHERAMGYFLVATRRDRDAAKDLTQETFVRVFRKLETLQNPERFSSWFFTIARRIAATHGASDARYLDSLSAFEIEYNVHHTSEDKRGREARIELVRALLAEVDDEVLAKIVHLRYTEPEHTTREIAQALGLPHGTVTSKLLRFRAKFKHRLTTALRELEAQEVA